MAQSGFEQASERISDTMHSASRAASATVEAIEDGAGAARRAAKQGAFAAQEIYCDAKRRVQSNPLEAIVATFAAGVAAGTAISWMMRLKRRCDKADAQQMGQ